MAAKHCIGGIMTMWLFANDSRGFVLFLVSLSFSPLHYFIHILLISVVSLAFPSIWWWLEACQCQKTGNLLFLASYLLCYNMVYTMLLMMTKMIKWQVKVAWHKTWIGTFGFTSDKPILHVCLIHLLMLISRTIMLWQAWYGNKRDLFLVCWSLA